jgi:hypothetical protein
LKPKNIKASAGTWLKKNKSSMNYEAYTKKKNSVEHILSGLTQISHKAKPRVIYIMKVPYRKTEREEE